MMKSGYDFYLGRCLLPVTPSKLTVQINNANETVTLIDEGEINILRQAGLTEIEFECAIPQVQYPFAVYPAGFQDANYFLDYFEALKTSCKPFQFIVCRRMPQGSTLFDTNIRVSLEDYRISEDAKDGFDLNVKISLKQWMSAKTGRRGLSRNRGRQTTRRQRSRMKSEKETVSGTLPENFMETALNIRSFMMQTEKWSAVIRIGSIRVRCCRSRRFKKGR